MDDTVNYSLRILGTRPSKIPMARLAIYLEEFAKFLGSQEHVHFSHLEDKSVGIVAYAPTECVAVISPRIRQAASGDRDASAHSAWKRLNEMLAEDGWHAKLPLPNSSEVIEFHGIAKLTSPVRSVTQPTVVQGRVIRLEGGGDTIHIGLEIEGDLSARISVSSAMSEEIAPAWHKFVRISGEGRWRRDDKGRWTLERMVAASFEVLDDAPIGEVLDRLRKIIKPGSGAEIVRAVEELRRA